MYIMCWLKIVMSLKTAIAHLCPLPPAIRGGGGGGRGVDPWVAPLYSAYYDVYFC